MSVTKDRHTCATSGCGSFSWARDTERPTRWARAAREGRLFIHGFLKHFWRDARTALGCVLALGY